VLDRFATVAEADVFSVIRKVGVPRGITTLNKPNISSTIWRTVSDQKERIDIRRKHLLTERGVGEVRRS
jgi:penicillin V acylase-like amidase (Ntn superfamily)